MDKKYYLHSLGCKVNSYENAALGTELSREGWTRVSSFSDADLIILNTCSVTGRADQKSRQHISSFRKGNSCAIIVAMGCYTQTHAEQAASLGANIVLGAADRALVLKYIEEFKRDGKTIIDIKKNIRHES